MNNKTTYYKNASSYTRVSHSITDKNGLNVLEIGIMTSLLCNTDDWIVYKENEQSRSGIGRKAFNKAWNNLVKKGFIYQQRLKCKGKICFHYHVFNEPALISDGTQPLIINPPLEKCLHKSTDTKDTNNKESTNEQLRNKESINEECININIEDKESFGLDKSMLEQEESYQHQNNNFSVSIIEDKNVSPIEDEIRLPNNQSDKDISSTFEIENNTNIQMSFSSVQDEVKYLIRKYVIDNRIDPSIIKMDINDVWDSANFKHNNMNTANEWVNAIIEIYIPPQYHNTLKGSSKSKEKQT